MAGFSVMTFLPAARPARASGLCTSFGVQMKMASAVGSARPSARSAYTCSPAWVASSRARGSMSTTPAISAPSAVSFLMCVMPIVP